MILIHTCSRCKKDYEIDSVPSEHSICPDCWIGDKPEFQEFKKIPRLSRDMVVTEKIDGTNGLICITDSGLIFAGSRNRWLWNSSQAEVHNDNHGFAKWVKENKEELMKLGPGFHYGEWWGSGIQRGYGLEKGEKRFSLFNTGRWIDYTGVATELKEGDTRQFCPKCCYVVPILYQGPFCTVAIQACVNRLKRDGSVAVSGFMKPEGVVVYHVAAGKYFKKTIENDEFPKGAQGGPQSS